MSDNIGVDKVKRRNKRNRVSQKDIEVLATLLVAFPQVSRAVFDPEKRGLSLVFLCQGPISKSRQARLERLYRQSIDVYLGLEGLKKGFVNCSWEGMDEFCSFQVERDVASLSTGELSLTAALVSENVPVLSALDDSTITDDTDFSWSARFFLQEMLDQVREIQCPRKLVALREGEKVLVFDK
ncbi:MAG: hypothetical protein ACOYEQ_03960 [Bacillota bacterium]|jgi:hypothetical protein